MKINCLLFICAGLTAWGGVLSLEYVATTPTVTAAGAGDAWVNLSEGTDLTKHWFTEGNWSFTDGVFKLTPRPGETGWKRWKSYLWSKRKDYGDFEIKFEYKIGKNGNSGFFFRVDEKNMFVEAAKYGLEVQIMDSADRKGKFDDHFSGGLIPGNPPLKSAAKPVSEWNTMDVTNKGDKLTVILNGMKVQDQLDLTMGVLGQRPKTGPIGFQDEALPIMIRGIYLREFKK